MTECDSFQMHYDAVCQGWTAKVNEVGVIYYVNDVLQLTSWNHPYLEKVFEELEQLNRVKYAAYRMALKLRSLQAELGLQYVSMDNLKQILPPLSRIQEEGSDRIHYMSCAQILDVILKLLESSEKHEEIQASEKQMYAELLVNFLLNLYDIHRGGKLPVRSVQIALATLCPAKLNEKYKYFFACLACDAGQISRDQMLYFVNDFMQVSEVLKESKAFGHNLAATVESCLKLSGDTTRTSISENLFYSWLMKEPQPLVWLPTLHRIIATENVHHQVRCSICQMFPINGLRYRCLQCLRYDLCQACFLLGRQSGTHKLKHPIQEYCLQTSTKDNTKALWKILKNKLSKRHRTQAKLNYLPVETDSAEQLMELKWHHGDLGVDRNASHCQSTDSGLAGGSDSSDSGGATAAAGTNKKQKPLEVLGVPCNSSSPFVRDGVDVSLASKQEMEIQQQKMLRTIQQLEEENRLLQQKLKALQRSHNHFSDDSCEDDVDNLSSKDPLKEITVSSPISPISEIEDPDESKLDIEEKENRALAHLSNTLIIVGTCTPVLTHSTTTHHHDESTGTNESECENETESDSPQYSSLPEATEDLTQCHNYRFPMRKNTNSKAGKSSDTLAESTLPNGLEYCSADMSMDFSMTVPNKTNDEQSARSGSREMQSYSNDQSESNKYENREEAAAYPSVLMDCGKNKLGSCDLLFKSQQPSDETVAELSEVMGSPCSYDNYSKLSPTTYEKEIAVPSTAAKAKMMPVGMSTPVNHRGRSRIFKKTDFTTTYELTLDEQEDKENLSDSSEMKENGHSSPPKSYLTTPASGIPTWCRQRILASSHMPKTPLGVSQTTMNLTQPEGDSTDGMSLVFHKAENARKLDEGDDQASVAETMATQDKEEMEKLMRQFEEQGLENDNTGFIDDAQKDSSLLEAVLNIGDAMGNLVHATTQETKF